MVVLQSTWLTRREYLLIYKVQVASLTQLGQSPISSPSPGIGSLIVSASACAAPRLHPIQLLLPDCVWVDCVCFSYYSPIVFASGAASVLTAAPNCVHVNCCSLFSIAAITIQVSPSQPVDRAARRSVECYHTTSAPVSVYHYRCWSDSSPSLFLSL